MTTSTPEHPPEALQLGQPMRVASLAARKPTRFKLEATADQCRQVAAILGLNGVGHLRFKGELRPIGRHDWELVADLEAEVDQPCSITLAPVVSLVREKVERRYLADLPVPEGDEVEMPEDEREEPLPDVIDPGAVALEALALALPPYPRAPGASLGEAVFAEQGVAPLRDDDLRPFSGLASLAERLNSGQKGQE